ncbi:FKBP-type peptidyl-prolyl cis-trans isomerase [uncultured Sunxiuqinia sp.]|uniref:FKBP-type peptidyl-prolyl cis-trans isomerase n=1 Tax=uncultured Sunxiuqinia sp. TaxID=1573825 RepID=UPI002AA68F55|nr:FKBP-type peptidyl-prolyl cis-trans isomerase [uncultured Sunxiuqinia sp.]
MAKREKKGKSKSSAGYNQKIGEDFLLQNAQKEGVQETASGLQYKIIEEVDGQKPSEFDTVLIHQRALLLNGTILEDTYRQNKPDDMKIEELIEGLQEGLLMMTKGSRYKFWIPSDLGWGRKGTSNKIPPFAVLAFDIRLVDILT